MLPSAGSFQSRRGHRQLTASPNADSCPDQVRGAFLSEDTPPKNLLTFEVRSGDAEPVASAIAMKNERALDRPDDHNESPLCGVIRSALSIFTPV